MLEAPETEITAKESGYAAVESPSMLPPPMVYYPIIHCNRILEIFLSYTANKQTY